MDSATLWYAYQNYGGKEGTPLRAKPAVKNTVDSKIKQGEYNVVRQGVTPDGTKVFLVKVDQHVAIIVDKEIRNLYDITKESAATAVFDRMIKLGPEEVHPYGVGSEMGVSEAKKNPAEVVESFVQKSPALLSPEGAFDRCKATAYKLRDLLVRNGQQAAVWQAAGYRGEVGKAIGKWKKLPPSVWMHYVVESGGQVFDLTRRQFDPMASVPTVTSEGEFRGQWDRVYVNEGWNRDRSGKLTHSSGTVIRQSANPEENGKWLVYLAGKATKPKAFDTLADARAFARKNIKEDAEVITGDGHCYDNSFRYVKDHPNALLCHGNVNPLLMPGRVIPHAWVEEGNVVIDDWMGASSKEKFYRTVRPTDIHKYNQHEAFVKLLRKKHYGPWDESVEADRQAILEQSCSACGCGIEKHMQPPDFGCENEPGCGCRGFMEGKVAGVEFPANHPIGMKVPKGGSSCAKCKFVSEDKKECGEDHFVKWNGGHKLPAPADEYCCDFYKKAVSEGFVDKADNAATSPLNTIPEPSQDEKEAGDYRKGTMIVHGMKIAIENPKGSVRSGDGWSVTMGHDYGYIVGVEGADGGEVDVFVGPNPDSENVYIVNQMLDGEFDEHKVVLGAISPEEAEGVYLSCYEPGWEIGPMRAMKINDFKRWLVSGDQTQPA